MNIRCVTNYPDFLTRLTIALSPTLDLNVSLVTKGVVSFEYHTSIAPLSNFA